MLRPSLRAAAACRTALVARPAPAPARAAPARSMGGPSSGGAGGTPSPEMAKYNATRPYLFGEKPPAPGQSRKWQHWESSFYLLAGGTAAAIALFWDRPNTRVTDWAKDEAEERVRRREAGLPVKYGVNYAMLKAMGKDPEEQEAAFEDGAAVGADDDDDDDDDEE